MRTRQIMLLMVGSSIWASGCHSIPSGGALLRGAVRFGTVESRDTLFDFGSRYLPFREALAKHLDRVVAVDSLLLPSDVATRFTFESIDFAFVRPGEFAFAAGYDVARPLLVMTDVRENRYERAYFVVRAESGLTSLADLGGADVAFGPKSDAVRHLAALHALRERGIDEEQLGRISHEELFIKPAGLLMQGKTEVALVRAIEYDSLDPASPERRQTRVIGETTPVPGRILLVRNKANAKLVARVKDWLLTTAGKDSKIFMSLRTRGFEQVSEDDIAKLREVLAVRDSRPPKRPTTTAPTSRDAP